MTDPTDIVDDLRDWASFANAHRADDRGFCGSCSLRMPCDTSMMVSDLQRAAAKIVRLRRSKEALVEIVKRHADTIAELRWQVEAFRKATAEHDCSLTKGSPDD